MSFVLAVPFDESQSHDHRWQADPFQDDDNNATILSVSPRLDMKTPNAGTSYVPTRNDSNLAIYTYHRDVVSMALRKAF